jgi:toxin ParE1/3/4
MKVVYTAGALRDLDEIGDWLSDHYPTIAPAVERRIHNVIVRIAQWPQSARPRQNTPASV